MKTPDIKGTFEILGEVFEIKYFPDLYAMFKANKTNLEEQLRSIADAWHEGNIGSAAIALESDLNHE